VIPIGSYHGKYGVTLSLPSIVGSSGIEKVLEPEMTDREQHALERSADAIRGALDRVHLKERREGAA
jgi:malate/lactate dehydrogenase